MRLTGYKPVPPARNAQLPMPSLMQLKRCPSSPPMQNEAVDWLASNTHLRFYRLSNRLQSRFYRP
jgi:hypothetical protein